MGQQELLLIVVGIIIVAISVTVSISVFSSSSLDANNSAIVSDLQTLSTFAQQYYRKPIASGGGGNSFDGWKVIANLSPTPNMSAPVIATITNNGQAIKLIATGNEDGKDGNKGTISYYINSNSVDSVVYSPNLK